MSFDSWIEYIVENEDMDWLISFFSKIPVNFNFYLSENNIREYLWYFWVLDKEKNYYIQERNENVILQIISFIRQYNVILKTLCFMGIYNKESELYFKYSSIFYKLIDAGNKKKEIYEWMYPNGKFTFLQQIFAITKIFLNEKRTSFGKLNYKKNVKNINIVKEDFIWIKETFEDFIKFRNMIMHSETSIYFIIQSENIEKESKDDGKYKKEMETINSLKIAKKMMPTYLSQKEIKNEYNFRVDELMNWFQNIIKSLGIHEEEYYIIFDQIKKFCKYNEIIFFIKEINI